MFKDYEIVKYLSYDQATDRVQYLIKIIDDDFLEHAVGASAFASAAANASASASASADADAAAPALIKVYSQKQFNVAHNLTLLILRLNKKFPLWGINSIFEYLTRHILEFKPYSDQVKQLLLFS